jgi:hypothetical protein
MPPELIHSLAHLVDALAAGVCLAVFFLAIYIFS